MRNPLDRVQRLNLKEFYERDAIGRHAGDMLTSTHEISIKMANMKSQDVVLEIGCGGGALLSEIEKTSSKAVGLDISKVQVKFAKSMCQNAFLVIGDSQKLPFRDGVFTKCFAVEVLEHVPNTDQMVKEVHRCLGKEGTFIIVVPNDRNWFIHRIAQGEIREAFYNYGHLHDFSSVKKLKLFLQYFQNSRLERK